MILKGSEEANALKKEHIKQARRALERVRVGGLKHRKTQGIIVLGAWRRRWRQPGWRLV